jgi:ERCC4-related helicase
LQYDEYVAHFTQQAIEVDHALELLSASFAGINPLRRYAVKRLEEAKDEELLSYLLQLVQALRYEKGFLSDEQILASQTVQHNRAVSRICMFCIRDHS